jgi:4-amino-4-deoxy-L-arabinose transferase-like glycosyltransferase
MRRLGPLGLAVALALGVRAVAAFSEELIFNDGPEFVRIAEAFTRGDFHEGLARPFHPLTSGLMAGLHLATGMSLETAGRMLSVVAGGVGAAALYALGRLGWGPAVALSAALLFAVHPRMVDVGSSVQSDGLHLALALGAVVLGWLALARHQLRSALWAGVLSGCAYVTRPEGLAVAAVFGVGLGSALLVRRVRVGRGLALGCLFAVGLVAVSGPYLLALHDLSGSWTLSQKKSAVEMLGAVAALGSPDSARDEPGHSARSVPPARALQQPAEPEGLRTALGEVFRDGVRAITPLFLVLLLLGVRLRRPSAKTLYLLAFVGLFFLLLVGLRLEVGYVSRRHWLVGAALLLPFAGRGLVEGLPALAGRWLRPPLPARLAWGVLGVVVLGFSIDAVLSREDPEKLIRKDAAAWLRAAEPVGVLAAPRARDAYYAGARRWVPIPRVPDSRRFLRRLRNRGAGHLIAEASSVPADLREGSEQLPLLHRIGHPEGEVLVFRLGGAPEGLPDVAAGSPEGIRPRVEPRLPAGASGSPPPRP